eukprot:1750637-Prymnesium_polylepis.2
MVAVVATMAAVSPMPAGVTADAELPRFGFGGGACALRRERARHCKSRIRLKSTVRIALPSSSAHRDADDRAPSCDVPREAEKPKRNDLLFRVAEALY